MLACILIQAIHISSFGMWGVFPPSLLQLEDISSKILNKNKKKKRELSF